MLLTLSILLYGNSFALQIKTKYDDLFISRQACVPLSALWQNKWKHRKVISWISSLTCAAAHNIRILQSSFAGCFLSFSLASVLKCVLAGCQSEQWGSLISCLVLNAHSNTHRQKHGGVVVLYVFDSVLSAMFVPLKKMLRSSVLSPECP